MNDTSTQSQAGQQQHRGERRLPARRWFAAALSIAALATVWLFWSHRQGEAVATNRAAPLPKVLASRPLVRTLETRQGFLGQFSAVERVELRAQVGGTLTGIYFKDGDIVHRDDLLFTIDPVPYEIRLAQANAQLESATARLVLADRELARAQMLQTRQAA